MRYCTDTWFILGLFHEEAKNITILNDVKEGKDYLIIPMVVYAEATKKLLQRGVSQDTLDLFWQGVEQSDKIKLVELNKPIAQEAAIISLSYAVPMVDSFVAATAKITNCDILLASDADYNLLKKKYLQVQSW